MFNNPLLKFDTQAIPLYIHIYIQGGSCEKNILLALGGFVLDALILSLVLWNTAPSLMLLEDESKYGFEESIQKYQEAVEAKGWKIPAIHDLQKTMAKYGKDVLQVMVFELCHPKHAYVILSRDAERVVSSLMPCRVAIYKKSDGKVCVSRMNTALMGKMMGGVVPKSWPSPPRKAKKCLKPL